MHLYQLYPSLKQLLSVCSYQCIYHFTLWILCWSVDAMLTTDPNWSTFFTGESVTLLCDMKHGEDTDWYYRFVKDVQQYSQFTANNRYISQNLGTGFSGEYGCIGSHKALRHSEKYSNTVSLTVSGKHCHEFIKVCHL